MPVMEKWRCPCPTPVALGPLFGVWWWGVCVSVFFLTPAVQKSACLYQETCFSLVTYPQTCSVFRQSLLIDLWLGLELAT